MYRPDLKDAMIEGYTEALDECKDIAERVEPVFARNTPIYP